MSSLPPDPWKALGVERNADKAEIRTAYKKLVLKCHPDKVQDATLKAEKQGEFQKVQQAWELLNDDVERAKYEAQLSKLAAAKLHETSVKNSANTSVPRSAAAYYANVNIRTAEPPSSRYKGYSSSGKGYNHSSPHTRSSEEVPSARTYTYDEADLKTARRAASYDKVSSDDRRNIERKEKEDKRRRKEEEELRKMKEEREREREREREKDRDKDRKKKYEKLEKEKEKERERRRDEEKRRQHSKAYVESYNDVSDFQPEVWVEDEDYVTSSRSKKERSSSKKHDESRDRERQRDRERERERERERDKSASRHAALPEPERKHMAAMDYIKTARGSLPETAPAAFWKSESPQDSYLTVPPSGIPAVPTPPPAEPAPVPAFEEESIQRSARRAAQGRRPSHDTSRSSKEKIELHEIPELMTSSRSIPIHTKSSYTKPVPESPPRMNRTQTTPHESYDRPMPGLTRNQTWAAGDRRSHDYDDYGSDDDRERRRERRNHRRNRSPEVVYKIVDGLKTAKVDKHYSYGDSPTSSRRHASDAHDGGYSSAYGTSPMKFKVKESRRYGPEDVTYATYEQQPSSYYGEYVAAS
ncbi:hypothetical protein QBC44DRAFT_104464 [Cladorrhinum sp. PSN332]|nr:hypothetical protein QBC44DRAFT_104464 [Cladorrhinum sp. PSN332]